MSCAEHEILEQGCQAVAASRDSQPAGGAGVEQEGASAAENSGWSLLWSLSKPGLGSQPSVCGEKNQPAWSVTPDSSVKDHHEEDEDDDDDDCFHESRQFMFPHVCMKMSFLAEDAVLLAETDFPPPHRSPPNFSQSTTSFAVC